MNIIFSILLIALINLSIIFPRDSAYLLKHGERSMGIFQPRIYGLNEKMEFSTHPILFFIKPNMKLKIFHGQKKEIGIASRYSLDYPTPLLKLIQHRNNFAFISEDPDIGEIQNLLVLKGELLGTKKYLNYFLTAKLGISICPGCKMDTRHLIDYDLVYPRMAIYNYGIGANMGLDWDYTYSGKISLKADLDLLFLPEEHPFIEHKFLLHYSLSDKYTISGGYKFCYGYYPFSNEKGLWNLFPILDLKWKWKK